LAGGASLLPSEFVDCRNMHRYSRTFCLEHPENAITLGEGLTPLVAVRFENRQVLAKLEFISPTGSYKDRGSSVMVSKLREWCVTTLVTDSSGNAGASISAYAAAAGIKAKVFIPESTSVAKAMQIEVYGAQLIRVAGTREDATLAALKQVTTESYYASHNINPYFVMGLRTIAFELAEDMQWKVPDWIVLPLGAGNLLIGLWDGFCELKRAGLITTLPRLVGVQSIACAPIYRAWKEKLADVLPITATSTIAEGVSIAAPTRGREVLRAIRDSHGLVCAVSDEQVWAALKQMGELGLYVEPTSSVPCAALGRLLDNMITEDESVVVVLTGTGLKATEKIPKHMQKELK